MSSILSRTILQIKALAATGIASPDDLLADLQGTLAGLPRPIRRANRAIIRGTVYRGHRKQYKAFRRFVRACAAVRKS